MTDEENMSTWKYHRGTNTYDTPDGGRIILIQDTWVWGDWIVTHSLRNPAVGAVGHLTGIMDVDGAKRAALDWYAALPTQQSIWDRI